MNRPLTIYYAATALFLLFDYLFGINVRVAFLETLPAVRAGYYLLCFVCLGLMLWRPGWAVFIGAFESLIVVLALTFGMAMRVMIPTAQMLEPGMDVVTLEEVLNYIISGGIAYLAWIRGLNAVKAAKSR
ncbi:MAG: hypothetical protein K0U72_02575 [Gammaproteobacteria bacterium]|nr:hypothetical protein [Gammaproteobacteria bacterium]